MTTISTLIIISVSLLGFTKPQDDLWKACMQCDLEMVKKAIDKGADPKAMHPSNQNALALSYFCPNVTEYLIEIGVDPNSDGGNALVSAANNYSYEVVKMLLDAGAKPDAKAPVYGATAAEQVIKQTNCVPCLEALRDAGANLSPKMEKNTNFIHTMAIFSMTQEQRKQTWAMAAPGYEKYGLKVPEWLGNLDNKRNGTAEQILDILIAAGNDINAQIENPEIKANAKGVIKETGNTQLDYTPLMLAIGITSGGASAGAPGKHHIAELLIAKGADVNLKAAAFDATALTLASCQNNPDLVKALIDKGADTENEVWLIDHQTGLYMKGATPLVLAAKYNQLENCKLLIEAGAKITKGTQGAGKSDKGCFFRIKDKSGLYYAIETGNEEMVQLFLDNYQFWNNHTMEYIQPDQSTKQQFGNYVMIDNTCKKTAGPIRPGMHANRIGQKDVARLLSKKGL